MTDAAPSGVERGWWARWRGTLLVVSLAFNLLVLGIVAAGAVRHHFWPHPTAMQATIAGFARGLPLARRGEILVATKAERDALRPFRRELRRLRNEARSAVALEPFDAARFKAAQDQLMQGELRARQAAYTLYAAIALQLTPEERQAFARWQPRAERWGRWRSRGGPDDPGDDGETPAPAGQSSAKPAAPGR